MKNNISERILYIYTVLKLTRYLYQENLCDSEKVSFNIARQLTAEHYKVRLETLNSKFTRGCGKGYTIEYWEKVIIPRYVIGDYDAINFLKVMMWDRALTPDDIELINSL